MNEIIAYKGFNSKLQCRDFQYEIGKTYEHDGDVVACKSGFHACEYPLHVFDYYVPSGSRFCKVKMSGEIIRHEDKIVASKIEILEELSLQQLAAESVKMSDNVKYSEENYSVASNTGYDSVASNSGSGSVASNSGARSVASNTGARSVASNSGSGSVASNSGARSVASNSGAHSIASNTGYNSVASNTGYDSIASNTGDYSVASNTGSGSVASNTGYRSVASNSGARSVASNIGIDSFASNTGAKSVAVASGKNSKAKASLGSVIFLVYRDIDYNIIHHRSAMAGKDVKPDVFYKLDENGEFVECE